MLVRIILIVGYLNIFHGHAFSQEVNFIELELLDGQNYAGIGSISDSLAFIAVFNENVNSVLIYKKVDDDWRYQNQVDIQLNERIRDIETSLNGRIISLAIENIIDQSHSVVIYESDNNLNYNLLIELPSYEAYSFNCPSIDISLNSLGNRIYIATGSESRDKISIDIFNIENASYGLYQSFKTKSNSQSCFNLDVDIEEQTLVAGLSNTHLLDEFGVELYFNNGENWEIQNEIIDDNSPGTWGRYSRLSRNSNKLIVASQSGQLSESFRNAGVEIYEVEDSLVLLNAVFSSFDESIVEKNALAISPDGKRMAVSFKRPFLLGLSNMDTILETKLYNIEGNGLTLHYDLGTMIRESVNSFDDYFGVLNEFSPDGRYLLTDGLLGNPVIVDLLKTTSILATDKNEMTFNIFPNPCDEIVNVDVMHGCSYANNSMYIEIFNSTGQQMYWNPINNCRSQINVKNFPPGLYYIKLVSINSINQTIRKFIVN